MHENKTVLQSKKEGNYQESIQSSTTPETGYQWKSDNFTIRQYKRDPRGQPFPSRWLLGISKQMRTKAWQKQYRNNINDPQKKHRLGTASKNILLEGLNRFHGAQTSLLVRMGFMTHICLVCMRDP